MSSKSAMLALAFAAAAAAAPQVISDTFLADANSTNSTFTPVANLTTTLTNIQQISQYWGEVTPYSDNPENYFGISETGLPEGCQVEQAHLLQRHAQRFPTSGYDDGANDENFAAKVKNYTTVNGTHFSGQLSFLNSWEYIMGESVLTGIGAATEFAAGVTFWNRYGRILFDAVPGQVTYNASFPNGTARPKPVLRTTSQSRIWNSEISWAAGFFGPSFEVTPNPTLANFTDLYNTVVITEGGTENNTLASYDSCINDGDPVGGYIGDLLLEAYLPKYLANATARLNAMAPKGFTFSVNDTYAMQSICAYESEYIGLGMSAFCDFFTLEEWEGFELTTDMQYYYDYSYGNPTGRAQGIGYLQELIARLDHQYITASNTSVNSTLDNNGQSFPLNQSFYADFSHDDIIVSVLTSMSLDYFKAPPNFTAVPAQLGKFRLSNMTPFGARLVTEVIGCSAASPASQAYRTQYYPTQYGYNASTATHKFVRMRLNNGILPLDTIRGGACNITGRTDGLCPMSDFLKSQEQSFELSNYQYACFGNYTILGPLGFDYDGAITTKTA